MILRINILGVLCALALINPLSMMGQDKQFTLHDLIPGGKTQSRFVPRNLKQLQWCGDTYLYVKGDSMMSGESTKAVKVAFTRQQLNEALAVAGAQSVGGMPFFSVPYKDQPVLAFNAKHHRFHYDFVENRIVSMYDLNGSWENLDFCPANGYLAFTEEDNLKILSPDNAVSIVTDETAEGVVCGKSVHQNEFGIHKGTFWSPNGSALAFYRMDESMVTDYPFVDITARCAKAEPHKYPMAGMKSHEVTVGVYNLATGKTVWLKTGLPKEKYLTNITWSPDEKSIYIAELNRDQNEMHLVRYSALTGEKEADLFTEKNEHYVEPQHPVLFLPNNPDLFIWQSRRDGYNHLYLYNTKGELLKQLTEGEWEVLNILGFDAKGKALFFSSTRPSMLSSFSYGDALYVGTSRLDLKKGTSYELTSGGLQGVHATQLSASGKYLIDSYSAPDVPREISIIDGQKRETLRTLLTAKDPYEGYAMPEIVTDEIIDNMAQGRKALGLIYSGDAAYVMAENEDMGYYLPESGTNLWSDAMVIPANAKNPELAHEFINFVSDYEGAYDNSSFVGYTSANQEVMDTLYGEGGEYEGIDAYMPRSGYPKDEVFEYNEDTRKTIANLWSKVKIAASNAE